MKFDRKKGVLLWACLGSIGVSAGISGCKSKSASGGAASAGVAASAAPTPPIPPNVDADLYKELFHIASACKVDDKQALVVCQQGEQRKLSSDFMTSKRARPKAVGTLAVALNDKNPGVSTVAANLLYSAFRTSWGEVPAGAVPAKDADDLLTSVLALQKSQARQALPAAVHAEMLAGRADNLYAAIAKISDPPLRAVAVRHLMTHGRLDAFPKVQEFVKDDNPGLAMAALESPQNMQNWTEAEQAKICPWAGELLTDSRPAIVSKASSLIGSCGGVFVDKLLEAREKTLKGGTFASADLSGLRDLCSAGRRRRPNPPTDAQCARSRKLLEKVVDTKSLDEQLRNSAFTALAYQFPDAETLKLAKRLEKGTAGPLAETARRTIQRQEQKDAKPGASGSGRPPFPGALEGPGGPRLPTPAGHPPIPPPPAPPAADETP
jgi:hypothetical protein